MVTDRSIVRSTIAARAAMRSQPNWKTDTSSASNFLPLCCHHTPDLALKLYTFTAWAIRLAFLMRSTAGSPISTHSASCPSRVRSRMSGASASLKPLVNSSRSDALMQ